MSDSQRQPTRILILDSAEKLFAERGIDATSVREITQDAGANLASVSYYFGSKEGLVREVFTRRIGPINEERFRLLDRALEKPTVRLRNVVHAFVSPAIDMLMANPEEGRNFVRLMGRIHMDPDPSNVAIAVEHFEELIERFTVALSQALPGLDKAEVLWRFHFAIGTFAQAVSCGHLLEWYTEGACRLDDPRVVTNRVVTFMTAGLRAAPRFEKGSSR